LRYRNNLYHDEYLRPQMGSNMATVGRDKFYLGSVAMGTQENPGFHTQGLAQRPPFGGAQVVISQPPLQALMPDL
jgi:hypothetical protein